MTVHRPFLELAAAALDFGLSRNEQDSLARHLAGCPACRRTAAAVRADARAVAAAPMRTMPADLAPASLPAAIQRRATVSQLRLVALFAVAALLSVALVTIGSGLLRRVTLVDRPEPTAAPLTWVPGAPLQATRAGHSATLLPDGRVLVAGGRAGAGSLHSSEFFDPVTGTWSVARDMRDARSGHSAIAFFDEEVILFGGYGLDGSAIAGIESFVGDAWDSNRPLLIEPRAESAVAMVPPRGVMIIGGYGVDGRVLASVEILDMDLTGDVLPAAPLATARARHTATRLFDGRIVVTGGVGDNGEPIGRAELWDPTQGRWTEIAAMHEARVGHTAARLNDDRVLVAGGRGASGRTLATSELYDPETDTWTVVPMVEARERHGSTLFAGSTVLVVGGDRDGAPLATTEIFDPIADTWTAGPSLLQARATVVVRLKDGSAMAIGGESGEIFLRQTEILDSLATR